MRKAWVILGAAAILAACGHQGPVTGTLTTKHVSPAHIEDETVIVSQICVPSGKSVICTPIYGTEHIHVPDRFFVTLHVCKDEVKCRNTDRQVDEVTYRQAQEGDTITA